MLCLVTEDVLFRKSPFFIVMKEVAVIAIQTEPFLMVLFTRSGFELGRMIML